MEQAKEIKGILCKVENCKYHSTKNTCHAGKINVGPECSCCDCSETRCSTFEAK